MEQVIIKAIKEVIEETGKSSTFRAFYKELIKELIKRVCLKEKSIK